MRKKLMVMGTIGCSIIFSGCQWHAVSHQVTVNPKPTVTKVTPQVNTEMEQQCKALIIKYLTSSSAYIESNKESFFYVPLTDAAQMHGSESVKEAKSNSKEKTNTKVESNSKKTVIGSDKAVIIEKIEKMPMNESHYNMLYDSLHRTIYADIERKDFLENYVVTYAVTYTKGSLKVQGLQFILINVPTKGWRFYGIGY